MVHAPIPFKVHMCGWMVLFAVLPFTRLVHLFSGITAPFRYIGRAAIVYRRRKQKETNRSLEFLWGSIKTRGNGRNGIIPPLRYATFTSV